MNDIAKAAKILKVCELVAKMPSGGGWVRPATIVEWSSVPHATTYRYLPKLVKLGYLNVSVETYRNGKLNHYSITQNGIDYLKSFKEMF